MAIRLKDIARELDVSVITVSKALRGNTDISEATRHRVLTRMKELDYQPNMAARSLATGHSHILGLIVPDLVHPFFAELAKSLGGVLRRESRGLILASSEEDPAIEQSEIRMMLARGVDALLIASCQPDLGGFYSAHNQKTPYVLVDRAFPHLRASFVGTDDYAGGILATEHLITLGRKRLAHIGGPDLSPAVDRMRGFRDASRRLGVYVPEKFILSSLRVEESGDDTGYAMMQRLLQSKPVPDGVFCYNDITAIGAMQATLDAGLRIPGDVAFVGFGNVRYSNYFRIPLTSIDQSTVLLGQMAAQLALDLASKKQVEPRCIRLRPKLVIRESSGNGERLSRSTQGSKRAADARKPLRRRAL
jgi:LacI family transcriptional regulator